MKIVLLQPPIEDFYDTDIRLQPIGLCYLKSASQKHLPEIQIKVIDFHRGWGRKTISVPKELEYLKKFYAHPDQSPFSTFHHYYHFGAPFEKVAEEILKEKCDLVGISSLFSPYYREVIRCAEEIKKIRNVPILVGGSHVSAVPELMLKSPFIDFIIRGEGEKPFVEFLKAQIHKTPLEEVPNLGFKKEGRFILNEMRENFPIEEIPWPDLSDLDQNLYSLGKRPLTFVITSRGCPYQCDFCSVHITFGDQYRRRSNLDILSEIKQRFRDGYRIFDFEDDNFTFDASSTKSLLREFIKIFPSGEIHLTAMNGLSYQNLDSEMLKLMKEAGFTHLNLSLVSANGTIRKKTARPHTFEKYHEIVTEAYRLGFKLVSYQIIGLPNETLDSAIETLRISSHLPVLLGASIFYLTPHSPISRNFKEMTEEDIFKSRLTAMAIETEHFKREDLYTFFMTTRIINFLKSFLLQENEMPLSAVLKLDPHKDKRSALGITVLKRLLNEKILYAATQSNFQLLPLLKWETFERIWKTLKYITTLSGQKILIN